MRSSFIDYELLPHEFNLKSTIITTFIILGIEILFMFGMAILVSCIQIMRVIL
jgi:hypothetical protein